MDGEHVVQERHRANGHAPRMHVNPLPEIDLHAAVAFLCRLDPDATWCFRTLLEGTAGRKHDGTLEQVATDLMRDNLKGRGVFVVVNEGGHTKDEIICVRALFADFDPPKTAAMPATFDVSPTMIVESSPGRFHVYWLVDGLSVDEFSALQIAIARRYGSDPAVKDRSRVMRMPGFLHLKGEPFRTRVVHDDGDVPIDAQCMREALAPYMEAKPSASPSAHHHNGDGERVVDEGRHEDIIKLAARLVYRALEEGVGREAVIAALFAERARGRWTREVPDDEILRAAHGAFDKYESGEWDGPVPEPVFGAAGGARRKPDGESDTDAAGAPPWLREVSLASVATAPPVGVSFAVVPILPRGEVTILGGHGGAGKSICALTLAVAAACGESWCGFEPNGPLKVAYVSLEDHGEIVRSRVRNILHATRLSPQGMEGGLRVLDGSDGETALAVEVSKRGVRSLTMTPQWRELADACDGADVIIIDNASDAYAADENNRAQVRSFMRHLRALARKCNAAVLLLCHIDKAAARGGAQGNSYSGSTAWHNASRSRLALIPNADGTVLLVHERSSHRKAAEPAALGWTDSGVLLAVNGAQRAAEAARDAEDVLSVLIRAERLGIRIPTATRGPCTAWHAVADLLGLPASLTGKDASRRFHAALLGLAEAGSVIRDTYTDGHGHKREFWKLAQSAGASP